ncbi:MAG: hypothetical protein J6B32_05645 [Spirochaetaceae bacterium]|nr:hypothetical protein [Spirochaetaceae bacterium]
MKRKISIILLLCLFVLLLTSCNEVLSVVTLDEYGEKVLHQYILMYEDTVYDETITLKSWNSSNIFSDQDEIDMDELLFKIENKKENIVVLGDEACAIELSFFDGGCDFKFFYSMDEF